MKKTLLAMASVLVLLPVVGTSTMVQAASWHKGSPKIARGMWTDKAKYPKGTMYDYIHISKTRFVMSDNDPLLTHLRYKKVGKRTYKFRGYEPEARKYESTPKIHFTKHNLKMHQYGHYLHLTK
ncbi:hypothetical protein IV54_GL001558 [Levilactobacillus paucivorans]|uniref:DUF4822 domain-containing protein n=1 Tax=Levilactobacillus paucivorans TaxID=616990 RepID=A0A0R2LSX2_9LACO|nr:hypothetical protein [Levilactobacillus paucivorans]KRO04310.1 hypothetical protein IV54_GL001558 [Levilactobacillus paucivorans]